MAQEMELYTGGSGLTRDTRRAVRAISRARASTQVRLARVNDETDVALEKVQAQTEATQFAMGAVSRIALAQRHYEAMAPEASGRLSFLADEHLLGMGNTLQDHRRSMRCR
jgi:hypothetical protein